MIPLETPKPIDPRIEQILAQVELYQAIAADEYGVPAWQALPIASNPDIAFRPHCRQIEAIPMAGDTTTWAWQSQPVHSTPGYRSMTASLALELQAAGVCQVGSHAVDVPLVATDEVYTKFTNASSSPVVAIIPESPITETAAPVATAVAVEPASGFNPMPLLAMVFVLAGLGIAAHILLTDKPIKTALKSKSEAPPPPAKITDTRPEYDFKL